MENMCLYAKGIPAGGEYETCFETVRAPEEPGTYRLMEVYDNHNCHVDFVWEREDIPT